MCAYWDRLGETQLSKVISLALTLVPLICSYRVGSSQFRALGCTGPQELGRARFGPSCLDDSERIPTRNWRR